MVRAIFTIIALGIGSVGYSANAARPDPARNAGRTGNIEAVDTAESDIDILQLIPDDNFRIYLEESMTRNNPVDIQTDLRDTDGDGRISAGEAAAVTYMLGMLNCHVRSLDGIEHFTGLRYLYCYGNRLRSIDISKNRGMWRIECLRNPGNGRTFTIKIAPEHNVIKEDIPAYWGLDADDDTHEQKIIAVKYREIK